jgi:hypothetical protein
MWNLQKKDIIELNMRQFAYTILSHFIHVKLLSVDLKVKSLERIINERNLYLARKLSVHIWIFRQKSKMPRLMKNKHSNLMIIIFWDCVISYSI